MHEHAQMFRDPIAMVSIDTTLCEKSLYPEQVTTTSTACRSYSCQRRKMLPNNALHVVLFGPDWMVFNVDERLQK